MSKPLFISASSMIDLIGKQLKPPVVIEDDLVSDKQVLLMVYRNSLHANYMGRTWDSLWDVISSHEFIQGGSMMVVHASWPPRLPSEDLAIYLDIVFRALRYHSGDRDENCGQSGNHFNIVFVYKDEDDLNRIKNSLIQIMPSLEQAI